MQLSEYAGAHTLVVQSTPHERMRPEVLFANPFVIGFVVELESSKDFVEMAEIEEK